MKWITEVSNANDVMNFINDPSLTFFKMSRNKRDVLLKDFSSFFHNYSRNQNSKLNESDYRLGLGYLDSGELVTIAAMTKITGHYYFYMESLIREGLTYIHILDSRNIYDPIYNQEIVNNPKNPLLLLLGMVVSRSLIVDLLNPNNYQEIMEILNPYTIKLSYEQFRDTVLPLIGTDKVALDLYYKGGPYKYSTGICGKTTAGYGKLDDCGYWEYPINHKIFTDRTK